MIGLHGVYVPSRVKIPSVTAITATISTATGRRVQCRSPSLANSGSSSIPAIANTGATSITGVSIDGGRNANTA